MKKITKFNVQNKEYPLSCEETMGTAMYITSKSDAKQYLEEYIKYCQNYQPDYEKAKELALSNLGYWSGYYKFEVQKRVEKLFGAVHPIFGSFLNKKPPTAKEAFQCGVENKTLKEIREENEN